MFNRAIGEETDIVSKVIPIQLLPFPSLPFHAHAVQQCSSVQDAMAQRLPFHAMPVQCNSIQDAMLSHRRYVANPATRYAIISCLKEMFSFVDAGGASVTLRPEGTASVVRAVLSQKLPLHETQRLYYQGPMFRRER